MVIRLGCNFVFSFCHTVVRFRARNRAGPRIRQGGRSLLGGGCLQWLRVAGASGLPTTPSGVLRLSAVQIREVSPQRNRQLRCTKTVDIKCSFVREVQSYRREYGAKPGRENGGMYIKTSSKHRRNIPPTAALKPSKEPQQQFGAPLPLHASAAAASHRPALRYRRGCCPGGTLRRAAPSRRGRR